VKNLELKLNNVFRTKKELELEICKKKTKLILQHEATLNQNRFNSTM